MFKAIVSGSEATAPWRGFDSILERPDGTDARQNAWLTLQLRIKLNFCDSKNPTGGRAVQQAGKWFAKDYDDYLFPMLDWTPELIASFSRGFVKRALDTWNLEFLLITPGAYSELDYDANFRAAIPVKVRPNVLCLLRVAVIGPSGLIDNTPAAGPLRSGTPHKTITVVNLDKTTTTVNRVAGAPAKADTPNSRTITTFNDGAYRSDSDDYDDSDLFRPRVVDAAHKVNHDTVGHEIGHALGQAHIAGLRGDATCSIESSTQGRSACYGVDMDGWNIMGGGDKLYLVNAISWKERIALHTGLPATQWAASGATATPPRTMPAAMVNLGFAPAIW